MNRKQKTFLKLYQFTIIKVNDQVYRYDKSGKYNDPTKEELSLFAEFKYTTLKVRLKEILDNFKEMLRAKFLQFRIWQYKVLCDARSKKNNGRRYYILQDLNGDFHIINRDGFKQLKVRGLIKKNATFMDLQKEAIYYSK